MSEFLNGVDLNVELAYPFLLLIAAAIILLLCSAFYRFKANFYAALSLLALMASFFLELSNVNAFGFNSNAFLGTLNNDIIAFYAQCVILLFSFLYLLMDKKDHIGEFYALFLFMIASLMLMVSSSNLLLIFIGLEASSLALYTLIAMQGSRNAISSALKYFSVAAVGSGFFVLACAFIYFKMGKFDLSLSLNGGSKDIWLLSAGVLIFVLCAIKLSLAPFHFWLRDVYYASHSNLVAFISVVPKIAMFAVLIRLFDFFNYAEFGTIIAILAVFSMIVASLAALSQNDVKKMFAYSSVVHSSFVLVALVPMLSFKLGDDLNFVFWVVFGYWILFAFANYGVFLILSTLQKSSFETLNSLLNVKPFLAFALGLCALSLAGIPPFGLFWGKFMVLKSLVENDLAYLALFVALASVLMLYNYLKIIIHAFFMREKVAEKELCKDLKWEQKLALALCVIVNVFALLLML
ncbi:NADH-quinone oxidoreductase subunit N [Campylobacter upsaliensis]|mgnify:FL=1|uniref:NADH-quinone oxidoreductase subunit N n=1 Tax=Campylobacter upsaliensis TaxID=28080 RepID=A0A7U8B3D1_CAMUP|nr:NADH-quinone oxidoreductase subunit N [Campylobacter upsaliensis]EAB5281290.1 NADH-quinone oxidoreductase subunit N [Campylobacter upsaliensis]EAH4719443.1 NADH-quinone oxidoreductase subunit N [Campylobacter upsaliensis]EAH5199054.1 NADH-quinone oxidoreductase subunit N [Campylobacter upsaliensis]EAH5552785.1 NADH-quinone oxidoreductase subunit N [Campylobacter upsaliensis]EAH5676120.1 NADH-quinone oxidoreductase subunit N [Campylobacter upsaliensis]